MGRSGVPDVDASVDFYGKLMGWTTTEPGFEQQVSGVADALGRRHEQRLDTSGRSMGGGEIRQTREREKEREYGDPDGGGQGAQDWVTWARDHETRP